MCFIVMEMYLDYVGIIIVFEIVNIVYLNYEVFGYVIQFFLINWIVYKNLGGLKKLLQNMYWIVIYEQVSIKMFL